MKIAKKIEKLEEELQELKEQREIEWIEAKKKFVVIGKLIVTRPKHTPLCNLPEEFRRINISIEYTNAEKARKVGIHVYNGGMTYYYLEGWIVGIAGIGGGTMILDVPCKATEKEWQSIIDGDIPKKFLKNGIKKIVQQEE